MPKEQITPEFFMDKANENVSTIMKSVESRNFQKSEIKELKRHLNSLKKQLAEINDQINSTKDEIKVKRGIVRHLNWSIFKLKRYGKNLNNDYINSKKVNTKKYTKQKSRI